MVTAGKGEPLLLLDKPTDQLGMYGNSSLIYDRKDLILEDLPLLQTGLRTGSYVWYVTHSTSNPADKVPSSWIQVDSYQTGYARAHLYKLP
jgi:hypothetical protein